MELVAKYISVILSAAFKFVLGPTTSLALGLHWFESVILTVVGMMLSVFVFTFAGQQIQRFYFKWRGKRKKKKLFTRRNRLIVRVWKNYGLFGVAFLTPLILTPIGGTLVVASFGEKWHKISIYMLISGFLWSFPITGLVYYLGENFLQIILGLE